MRLPLEVLEIYYEKYFEEVQIWLKLQEKYRTLYIMTEVCFIFADNIKPLRRISLRVKWYQVDGITEEV